ncbi:hypothetical protein H9W90_06380 [Polaribacter pectinis]|uniref:Uncharacterized protein n=1 Tax=Polaribacter pectinis TaxID=2738844 RepID=A0A7G9LDP0_9FLAO|nr:hypothetical protein [Polaribacter pectinis]QNM86739.1 hypothetical protein H9W90_06380 [Polaribacter pectinis]
MIAFQNVPPPTPPPDPVGLPIDSGLVFLMLLAVLYGSYFILKTQKHAKNLKLE